MGYLLETKQDTTQFTQLLQAIENSGGGGGSTSSWTKLADHVLNATITNLQFKELLVIFHVDVNNDTFNYTMVIPKGETGTFVQGFYYSSQYSGSVGCSFTSTQIGLNSSWCKVIYNGSNVGTFKISVYYR